MIITEATERQKQIHDARRHFLKPRFEFWQQFATFVQASNFKTRVVSFTTEPVAGNASRNCRMNSGRGSASAVGEKRTMFDLTIGCAEHVQRKLKWNLLEW